MGATPEHEITVWDRSGKVALARLDPNLPDPFAWKAPHFVFQVLEEAQRQVCGGPQTCQAWRRGGFRIVSTLWWGLQKQAESMLDSSVGQHGKLAALDIHNGALAAIDYQTGEVIAYAGSADFFGTDSAELQAQFDVLSQARRQAGSIFKPFVYLPGLEAGEFTPASLFLDVSTEIEPGYRPKDHDGLERGPVRLRDALAYSLNIPAVKAAVYLGTEAVQKAAERFGISIAEGEGEPGPAIALGVSSVRPIEMLSAYGALANEGELTSRTTIAVLEDFNGRQIALPRGERRQVTTRQAAYLITDMLARETTSTTNPYLGNHAVIDRQSEHAVAMKTGTSDGARDLWTVGYLPPPAKNNEPAIAALLWLGNSDCSTTRADTAQAEAAPIWHAFVSKAARNLSLGSFNRPAGLIEATIDATSGYLPGPWTEKTVREIFPASKPAQDDPTKLPRDDADEASSWVWNLDTVWTERREWRDDVEFWATRTSASAPFRTTVTPFFNPSYLPYGESWGGAAFRGEQ